MLWKMQKGIKMLFSSFNFFTINVNEPICAGQDWERTIKHVWRLFSSHWGICEVKWGKNQQNI